MKMLLWYLTYALVQTVIFLAFDGELTTNALGFSTASIFLFGFYYSRYGYDWEN